jgi:predicted amidohydrolase YtcJ
MSAELVLYNGHIDTQDVSLPVASAVALRSGRILAVGSDEDMLALLAPEAEQIDLAGRAVTPGLVDAHVHFQWFSLSLQQIDLFEVPSLAEALGRVKAAADVPPGQWMRGRGWTQELWADQAFPTAAALDAVTGERPTLLTHKSGHAAWVNSAALRLAGITRHTPDPPGGKIGRDEAGRPTGILFEDAIDLVGNHEPPPTVADVTEAMRNAQRLCWEAGLVGLHDFDGKTAFAALQQLRAMGELGLRVVKNIRDHYVDHAIGLGLRTGFGDPWLRVGGVKMFADGALGPRTALMIEPYEDSVDNRGIAVKDKEEMMAVASRASAHGLSLTVHAIGDRANHDVLDVYEAVRAEEATRAASVPGSGPSLRHRIEHVQLLHPADRQRLAALGVIASMQPVHATSDMIMADRYWGERARLSYAWRTVANSGAVLVFGSDCPVEPIEPMLGIYAAVNRRRVSGGYAPDGWYPEEALTLPEAIRAFTWAAAYTSGQESMTGTIAPGRQADLTIFDRDIFAVAPLELAEVKIAGTIVDGAFKYRDF